MHLPFPSSSSSPSPSSASLRVRRALLPFVAAVALLGTAGTSVATAAESCGSIITAPLAR